ncbi:MAG: sensor histidine kinase N-terminal domain-containing protein [Alphaproteobacteria bacterium]|jgi:two-component system sensor histidine kinase TctE|nr:sensor histidine kinase N-terminal domain-containing protein [Alphaproteobacteria bacterium]
MTWRPRSLRGLLAAFVLAPLLGLGAAMVWLSVVQVYEATQAAYDRALAGSLLTLADRVVFEQDMLTVDLPYVALQLLGIGGEDTAYYRVAAQDHWNAWGFLDLPQPPQRPETLAKPIFFSASYRGESVRIAAMGRQVMDRDRPRWVLIEVAETERQRRAAARQIGFDEAARQLALVLLAAGLAWAGVLVALRPLGQISAGIAGRGPRDLTPLSTEAAPTELRPLLDSFNGLLDRARGLVALIERFTADAAHQLRSPVAGLRAQSELALRLDDPAEWRRSLEQASTSAQRLERLVDQLLALSRAEAQRTVPEPPAVTDIARLAREITADNVPRALGRGIDLGYDGPADGVTVPGGAELLGEALRNLVDNALRYCPAGAVVTVRVARNGEAIGLTVEDDGPGIPVDLRARAIDRFYRLPGSPDGGSGLGFAIAREIAGYCGGALTLAEGAGGRGLAATLTWPGFVAADDAQR